MTPIKANYYDITAEALKHGYWSGLGVIKAHACNNGEDSWFTDVLLLTEEGIYHIWPNLTHVQGRTFSCLDDEDMITARHSECLFEQMSVWY